MIEDVIQEAETEVQKLLSETETDVVAAAKSGWTVVVGVLEALAPEAKADLTAVLKELEVDVTAGDSVDSLVTDILNLAESMGKPLVLQIESSALSGLVAALLAAL